MVYGEIDKNYILQLRAILEVQRLTQEELARDLEVTFATLSRWIHGHAKPHRSHLTRIDQLHRQWVGFKPIPAVNYKKILTQSLKYKVSIILQLLQSNEQIAREFVVDSTYNSNSIEGTTLSLRETEVLIYDHQFSATKPYLDHLVSSNHASILMDIFRGKYLGEITEEKIKELHSRLFQGIRKDAGNYSKHQRGIIGLNLQLTHPEDIPEEMKRFVKNIRQKTKKQAVLEWMASSHAEFEWIHPFGDGNGRIGRLILLIQCLNEKFPPLVIQNKRKVEYYEVLEEAQRRDPSHLTQFLFEELQRSYQMVRKYL